MPKRTWWPADDDDLRRLYGELAGTGRLREIGPRMGRTPGAVVSRAKRLGIADVSNRSVKGDQHPHWNGGHSANMERARVKGAADRRARGAYQRIPWSEADDAQLVALCAQMSVREVAKTLGRTYGSTRTRVEWLNIPHRSRAWQQPGEGHHNWKGGRSAASRRKSYRLEPEEFERMITEQDGRCAICRRTRAQIATIRGFHVDHDHATGDIRGLLCHHCNLLLGNAADSVEVLRQAIEYLKRYEVATAA
jgi:Recombination endonuclease VII